MSFGFEFNGYIAGHGLNFYVGEEALAVYWVALIMSVVGACFITSLIYKRLFNVPVECKKIITFVVIFLISACIIFNATWKIYKLIGIDLYEPQAIEDGMGPDGTGYYGR